MSNNQKTSYAVETTVQKNGRVQIQATVTARFHKATGDHDGWATIQFTGTESVQRLAEWALQNRKLAFTSAIRREAELEGKFETASPEVQARYVGLLDRAQEDGVNFGAPVVLDPEKARRFAQKAWDAIDTDSRIRIMAENSGRSEEEVREMLSSMNLI